mgnify:CR=1 FL=1
MMKKINDIIGDAKTIGIAGHVRPDGDCMGSCMSLYNYLKKNRPDLDVRVFLEFVDKKSILLKIQTRLSQQDMTVLNLICLYHSIRQVLTD